MNPDAVLLPDFSPLEEACKTPESHALLQTWNRAVLDLKRGNLTSFRTSLESLEENLPSEPSSSLQRLFRSLLQGGQALMGLLENRPREALDHAREGLNLLEGMESPRPPARRILAWLIALQSDALLRVGEGEIAREGFLSALEHVERLLQESDRTTRRKLRREQAGLLLRLGQTALADGLKEEGLPYLKEALRLTRQISRREPEEGGLLRMEVLDLISRVERENGELRRALRHIREALRLAAEVRDSALRRRWLGHLRHREALILLSLGSPREAVQAALEAVVARKSLARRRNSPHRRDYAQSLLLFALALQAVGKSREARRVLDRSVRIHRERWRREGSPEAAMDLAAALLERAELLLEDGAWKTALRDTARALKLLEPLSPKATDTLEDWVHACHLRARIYREKGDLARAQRMFEQTLRKLDRMGHTETPFFERLARAYLRFLRKTRRKPGRGMEHLLSPRFPFPRG